MKKILAATASAILAVTAVPGLAKQDKNPPILVDANSASAQWASAASQDLDRELQRMAVPMRRDFPNALVQIRFEVENGEPVNVRVHRQSGDRWLDRAAMRSVERMDNLGPMPVSYNGSRTVQANIITARDDRSFAVLNDELLTIEEARLASTGPDRTVIALNAGSMSAG